MNQETKNPRANRLQKTIPVPYQVVAGALVCVLFGALLGWGVHALWQMDDIPVTSTLKEQMMYRKTRTMEQILDGLVRGNMRSVEKSAEHMRSIGVHLDWYSSSELYENNDERFRQSTLELIEAAKDRDHDAAKESALRLERSMTSSATHSSTFNRIPTPDVASGGLNQWLSTSTKKIMQRFKNILAHVSLKLDEHPSLTRAARLAKQNDAKLTVISVINEHPTQAHAVLRSLQLEEKLGLIEQDHRDPLEELVQPIRASGLDVATAVATGSTFVEVIRAALRNKHDLEPIRNGV